jgi:hypothetical protein
LTHRVAIAPARDIFISPLGLGTWLGNAKLQIAGGMRLCNELDRNKTAWWWIEQG